MTKEITTPADLRIAMEADWESYHAVYECSGDKELQAFIDRANGNLTVALELCKEATELFNEMQSNCF